MRCEHISDSSYLGRIATFACPRAVAKLIRKKREREGGVQLDKPVTIVLIDDRKHDAWGNCQVCFPCPRALLPVTYPAFRPRVPFERPADSCRCGAAGGHGVRGAGRGSRQCQLLGMPVQPSLHACSRTPAAKSSLVKRMQANDERFLCHIPAYNAVSEPMSKELVTAMERILPVETLRKFYCAFRDADPTHALIQCVDIMSDDQVPFCCELDCAAASGKLTWLLLASWHPSGSRASSLVEGIACP